MARQDNCFLIQYCNGEMTFQRKKRKEKQASGIGKNHPDYATCTQISRAASLQSIALGTESVYWQWWKLWTKIGKNQLWNLKGLYWA